MPSKIQFIRLEDIDNELFDGTNAAYDISQRYQKLPERSTKPAQSPSRTHTDDQSSNQATNEESKSQSETNFESSQVNQEQSEGERDNRTISESSQKGQQDESKNSERASTTQPKTDDEFNSKAEDSKSLLTLDLLPESTERQQCSVDINDEIKYVKIKLFKNHENKLNVFNQIGIISILCYGKQILEHGKEDVLTNLVMQKSSASKEDISQDSSSPNRRHSLAPAKTSTIDIFDDKIAALTTSKNKCVDNENYVEADKLKQIIAKIEKLKNYIGKLETQKFEHASNEDYDQAKKLKNEINRIKNVVLSITSGDTNAKPKIVAPYGNTQSTSYIVNKQVNQDQSISMRSNNSFENSQLNSQMQTHNAYSYTDNDAIAIQKQHFSNLKSSNTPYKRSGILKMKGTNANLDNSVSSVYDHSAVNSTINLSYLEDNDHKDNIFSGDIKKHVRIMDVKAGERYDILLLICLGLTDQNLLREFQL